jgi:sec-independent protein translocase protein TatA
MPEIGPAEILMVALVALIVFGPDKLPEMARSIGKALADLRRVVDEAKGEFQSGLNFDEDDQDHPMNEAVLESTERPDPRRYHEVPASPEDDDQGEPAADSNGDRWSSSSGLSLTPIPDSLDSRPPREDPDDV